MILCVFLKNIYHTFPQGFQMVAVNGLTFMRLHSTIMYFSTKSPADSKMTVPHKKL